MSKGDDVTNGVITGTIACNVATRDWEACRYFEEDILFVLIG